MLEALAASERTALGMLSAQRAELMNKIAVAQKALRDAGAPGDTTKQLNDQMALAKSAMDAAERNTRDTFAAQRNDVEVAFDKLRRKYLEAGGAVSVVDPKKCVACLTCVRVCPYGVPRINADGVAEIPMASCQGCGVCAGECPAKAIELLHYRDAQIICKSEALLQHEPAAVKS